MRAMRARVCAPFASLRASLQTGGASPQANWMRDPISESIRVSHARTHQGVLSPLVCANVPATHASSHDHTRACRAGVHEPAVPCNNTHGECEPRCGEVPEAPMIRTFSGAAPSLPMNNDARRLTESERPGAIE